MSEKGKKYPTPTQQDRHGNSGSGTPDPEKLVQAFFQTLHTHIYTYTFIPFPSFLEFRTNGVIL